MERAYMPALEAGFWGFDSPLPHQFEVSHPQWRDASLFDNVDDVNVEHRAAIAAAR
jgi:hypothetical protein